MRPKPRILAQRHVRERRLSGAAVFALGGEELGPGDHLGVLLEQSAALAFGHAPPNAEFDAVIEGVGPAFQDHRAVSTDHGGLALGGTADKKFVGIGLAAAGLGHPCDAGLCLGTVDNAVTRRIGACPARGGACN
jgi:hypothetical protein